MDAIRRQVGVTYDDFASRRDTSSRSTERHVYLSEMAIDEEISKA